MFDSELCGIAITYVRGPIVDGEADGTIAGLWC